MIVNLKALVMKKIIFTLVVLFVGTAIHAQNYRDYDVRNGNRYNYRDKDRPLRNYNANSYRGNYGYRYLPVRVRNQLNRLERRLAERRRCALEDGWISRREARRIRNVEREIDELLFAYRANNYRSGRNNRICR